MSLIVQVGHPVLRQKAIDVPLAEISSENIQSIIADMEQTVANEPDGAALAAPQIGVPLRIFVLSRRVFSDESEHEAASKDPHFIFINPVIIKRSKRKASLDEGCLSVRGRYGTIVRSSNVTVRAYDEQGQLFTRGAAGLLAQAFQHECDHLEGTLFIDGAKETWEVDAAPDRR